MPSDILTASPGAAKSMSSKTSSPCSRHRTKPLGCLRYCLERSCNARDIQLTCLATVLDACGNHRLADLSSRDYSVLLTQWLVAE